jgi:hypothetical protein
MTNSTDLFQPEYEQLALPAQTAAVFIDGVLREDLEPVEIVRAGWPQFDRARVACHSASGPQPEPGASVCIQQFYDANPPQRVPCGLPVFVGLVEGTETAISDGNESIEIIARDFSATLERITVYGQHIVQSDGSAVLLAGLPTAFNPAGQGNAAARSTTLNDRTYTPFSSSSSESRLWTCAEAIAYLLSEYLPGGMLHWPDVAQLEILTEGLRLRDLDVTGMTLLEALHQCAQYADLSFRFVPQLIETGPAQALVFYRNGGTRCVELNAQPAGQSLSVSRANIAAFQSTRYFHPVTHRTIGQGDFKVYEATFELVKAWDPDLESSDYATFSASTNSEFSAVKDVYRKWCLNETGDYAAPPFDLSGIFGSDNYVRRHRRFWPALSTDAQGGSLGYCLEASFDDGMNWWQYLHPFNNLLDECGVWLSGDRLDVDTWVAALKGVLRFRITASVVSDERLTCTVADGPVGSAAPVVDHILTLPRQFQYRKVSPHSILQQAGRLSDQADDTAALFDFVRRQAAASVSILETIQVQTPSLWLHLHPGDRVTSGPDSRDWLGCRDDNRSIAWIDQVRMDFPRQCTELTIVRQRQ